MIVSFRYALKTFLFLFLTISVVQAQVCSAPVVDANNNYGYNLSGIGDGCTLKSEIVTDYGTFTLNAAWIPNISLFQSTFTNSCNRHDKCLTQIGSTGQQCHDEFLGNMRNACDAKFPWYQPVERDLCRQTANEYYFAVKSFNSDVVVRNFQRASVVASRNIGSLVQADSCGTTPERAQLYSNNFINEVNSAFLMIAGRYPTVYEFMNVANSTSYIDSNSNWKWNLQYLASVYASQPAPPAVSYTSNSMSGLTLTAGSVSGASYLWKVNNQNYISQSVYLASAPRTNQYFSVSGFLRVTQNGIRNMTVIDRSFLLVGSCSPRPGMYCSN